MVYNFETSFENNKIPFSEKFGIEWNVNPQLYLTYLQTLYSFELFNLNDKELEQLRFIKNSSDQILQLIGRIRILQ